MEIVFAGPGALGSLFAARISLLLSQLDGSSQATAHSLWLLDYKKERARQLSKSGIILKEKEKQTHCSILATHQPAKIGACDALFLCVKSHAVPAALAHAQPILSKKTLLISMQNGIGHLDAIQKTQAIPVAAITSEGATLLKTGHVIHGGSGITRLGFLDQNEPQQNDHLDIICQLLSQAGIQTLKTKDPARHIWNKLFANIGINALTVLHDVPNGRLLDSAAIRKTMEKAISEAITVAAALGIPVEGDPVLNTFEICRKTSRNISSMLQDARRKRLTEIDAINGAIVKAGENLKIPTPVNQSLVAEIKKIERSYS